MKRNKKQELKELGLIIERLAFANPEYTERIRILFSFVNYLSPFPAFKLVANETIYAAYWEALRRSFGNLLTTDEVQLICRQMARDRLYNQSTVLGLISECQRKDLFDKKPRKC